MLSRVPGVGPSRQDNLPPLRVGSWGRDRTYDRSVNSRLPYRLATQEYTPKAPREGLEPSIKPLTAARLTICLSWDDSDPEGN